MCEIIKVIVSKKNVKLFYFRNAQLGVGLGKRHSGLADVFSADVWFSADVLLSSEITISVRLPAGE